MTSTTDRTIRYRNGQRVITNGNQLLRVDERELYTRYRLESDWQTILWLDVRNCTPLPNYQQRIIYARTVPWFAYIYYAVRDWFDKRRSDRELDEWWKKDQARRAEIRERARKYMGTGRLGGRYNR
jgi:hypothetical protein